MRQIRQFSAFALAVQLGRFVKSRTDRSKAVEVARSVGGVTSAANDMRIN